MIAGVNPLCIIESKNIESNNPINPRLLNGIVNKIDSIIKITLTLVFKRFL